ncbi:MAG: M56 family metallopeptidase, partial [Actinomycetia bacterium]|nr:M56 family metallopeptidase [Actinomycetes bacterium]
VRRNVVKCLSKPGEIKRLMGREDVEGRKIKVKVIERIEATAFVTGIFNPVVYISQDLIGVLSREEIFAVIAHEYAHFKKLDHFKILFASFLKDIIFFIPLAGFFLKNYLSEKEFNADEGTLENVENEFILAGAILKAMKLRIKPASTKLSFSANFSDELPEKRIEKLMGKKVTRGKTVRLIISIILSLAIMGFILGTSYRASSEAYIDCCQTGETCGYTEISCCVE